MTPWLALARAGADSFRRADRADTCQKPMPLSALEAELPAPNGPIGTGLPIGTTPAIVWPTFLVADPAEITLRGELATIEERYSR